jgi:hypothetical protein
MLVRVQVDYNTLGAPQGLCGIVSKMLGVSVGDMVEAYENDDDPPFSYLARVVEVNDTAPPSDEEVLRLEIIEGTRRDWLA